jgi:hypothetical protein
LNIKALKFKLVEKNSKTHIKFIYLFLKTIFYIKKNEKNYIFVNQMFDRNIGDDARPPSPWRRLPVAATSASSKTRRRRRRGRPRGPERRKKPAEKVGVGCSSHGIVDITFTLA